MTRLRLMPLAALGAFAAALPGFAFAQDGRIDVADSGDTAWALASSLLALGLALPGLALFYGGLGRERNRFSVALQVGAIFAAVTLAWLVAGYTIAFGTVTSGWLGSGNAWMLIVLGNVREATALPESAFVVQQLAFAVLAAAVMVGAWADRARLGWAALFCGLWSLVVYAPVAHWLWGGGWLSTGVGTTDWAGGILVHTSAGVSALVVAIMLGRSRAPATPPHSPAMVAAGGALLWAGWLALNGGAALAANDDAAAAVIAAQIAASAGALTWLGLDRLAGRRPGVSGFAMGALAGIATIAAGSALVAPGAAVVLGGAGAFVGRLTARLIRNKLGIDDVCGVFAIHGACGMLGGLLAAVFMSDGLGGVGYDDGMNMIAQIVAQAVGIGIVVIWSAIATVILALMVSLLFPMRASEDAELEGLDLAFLDPGDGRD